MNEISITSLPISYKLSIIYDSITKTNENSWCFIIQKFCCNTGVKPHAFATV